MGMCKPPFLTSHFSRSSSSVISHCRAQVYLDSDLSVRESRWEGHGNSRNPSSRWASTQTAFSQVPRLFCQVSILIFFFFGGGRLRDWWYSFFRVFQQIATPVSLVCFWLLKICVFDGQG